MSRGKIGGVKWGGKGAETDRSVGSRSNWRRHRRVILTSESPPCRLSPPGGRYMLGRRRQTNCRHVAIDGLILPGSYQVGLVPDTYTAVSSNHPVESFPGRQMRIILAASKSLQIFEGAPVLNQCRTTPGEKCPAA